MNDMETNNVTQWVIIGAAVVVLIVGGAWLIMRERASEPTTTGTEDTATTAPVTTVGSTSNVPQGTVTATSDGESVAVSNQGAGSTVTISAMSLTRASWIAVRDDQSILGAAWFPSSATSGTVELQRSTVSGKSYRVVMYVDDGDKQFDFRADQLITADGAPIGVSFTAN